MEVIELNIDHSLILTFCSHQFVLYCTVFYSIKTQRRFVYDVISLKYDRLPISSLLFASVLIKAREQLENWRLWVNTYWCQTTLNAAAPLMVFKGIPSREKIQGPD